MNSGTPCAMPHLMVTCEPRGNRALPIIVTTPAYGVRPNVVVLSNMPPALAIVGAAPAVVLANGQTKHSSSESLLLDAK